MNHALKLTSRNHKRSVLTLASALGLAGVSWATSASAQTALTYPFASVPATAPTAWLGAHATVSGLPIGLKAPGEVVKYADTRFSSPFDTPLCISVQGWVGAAYALRTAPGQTPRTVCVANGQGETVLLAPRALLSVPEGRHANWLSWSSALVEPRGAGIAAVQANGRSLYACVATDGPSNKQRRVYGYVGDDGRCHGVSLNAIVASGNDLVAQGERKGFDNYMLLMNVQQMSGEALLPTGGWKSVKDGILPRGVLTFVRNQKTGEVRATCRVMDSTGNWPGYVNPATRECNYFRYVNGQTQRASSSTYEVHRELYCKSIVGNASGWLKFAAPKCEYRTGDNVTGTTTEFSIVQLAAGTAYSQVGGKSFWLCQAAKKNASGQIVEHVLGFTSDRMTAPHSTNGCTDGTTTLSGRKESPTFSIAWYDAPYDGRG